MYRTPAACSIQCKATFTARGLITRLAGCPARSGRAGRPDVPLNAGAGAGNRSRNRGRRRVAGGRTAGATRPSSGLSTCGPLVGSTAGENWGRVSVAIDRVPTEPAGQGIGGVPVHAVAGVVVARRTGVGVAGGVLGVSEGPPCVECCGCTGAEKPASGPSKPPTRSAALTMPRRATAFRKLNAVAPFLARLLPEPLGVLRQRANGLLPTEVEDAGAVGLPIGDPRTAEVAEAGGVRDAAEIPGRPVGRR
jgi:hypothetical protein